MPRRKIVFYPNVYYHIYNRSFDHSTIFIDNKDYGKLYMRMYQLIDDYTKFGFNIKAFCVMPNHFHVLIRFDNGEENDIVSKFFGRLQISYARYFSMKYDHQGQIFQTRFKAKAIVDEKYLMAVVNYIQRNSEKHFNIPYKERQWRSDVNVEGNFDDIMKRLEDFKLEV